jgi:pimeloyl-ACP methyl ester carboxylesterase
MQVRANGITLEVEDAGSPQGEPLLLIMGLGMQLTAWDDDFVSLLAGRGYRVIRFDNRDAGLSHQFDAAGRPNLPLAAARAALRLPLKTPYGLHDMADDAVGVLDALGIAKAHVCGASMGGMVAQHLAARHPDRLASLTLMMTTSGARARPGRPGAFVRPCCPVHRHPMTARRCWPREARSCA